MTRARHRRHRRQTADVEWLHRRDDVVASHPGDLLAESSVFWANEPGVPDDLRDSRLRYRRLAVADNPEARAHEAEMRERYADLLEACRAWLRKAGY